MNGTGRLIITCYTISLLFLAAADSHGTPVATDSNVGNMSMDTQDVDVTSQLVVHDVISITDESDFTSLGFSGNGTSGSPFVIEGLRITSYNESPCIWVEGLNKTTHYVITDCELSDFRQNGPDYYAAIHLMSGNGVISGCKIHNSSGAIALSVTNAGAGPFSVDNNHIWNCSGGIFLDSNETDITNNIMEEVSERGIVIRFASDVLVRNNTIEMVGGVGIEIHSGERVLIEQTRLNMGIRVNHATDLQIDSCKLNDSIVSVGATSSVNGFRFLRSEIHGIIGVWAGGINVCNNTTGTIEIYQAVVTECRGIVVWEGVSGGEIHENLLYHTTYGIAVSGSDFLIHNNTVDSSGRGIELEGSRNHVYYNSLVNNSIINARDDGSDNSWDDNVSMGNYWSDYNGTGVYPIPGSAGSVDRFPRMLLSTTTTGSTTTTPEVPLTVILAASVAAVIIVLAAVVYLKRR